MERKRDLERESEEDSMVTEEHTEPFLESQHVSKRRTIRSHYCEIESRINEEKDDIANGAPGKFIAIINEVENIHQHDLFSIPSFILQNKPVFGVFFSPSIYHKPFTSSSAESSSSASYEPAQSKAKYNPEGDSNFLEDETTKILARKVANHYSARTNQTLEEREASPIIHLKKLNNWIKSVLIQLYTNKGDAVLDLACGKGGDLIKWDKARIGYYVGIDIAEGSIEDCRTRYNGDADHHQRRKKFSFPARLICGDCFEIRLDKVLAEDAPFDVCSCQFAMHYSWSTEARARRALANVSALLRPGGIFIGTMPDANVIVKKLREAEGLQFDNSVYWIRFDEEFDNKKFKSSSPFGIKYKFHLEDAVDCPEWIVPFHVFKSLAEEYGLELVFVKNSHVFVEEYMKKPEYVELMRRLGALGDGKEHSTLSPDEWEVAYLYLAFVLRKRGQPGQARANSRRDKGKMNLSKEDIMYIADQA